MNAPAWNSRSIGSRLQHGIFYAIIRFLGRTPAYGLLFFVVLWYSLRPLTRSRSRPYLRRRFPEAGPFMRFVHRLRLNWNFGLTLVDIGGWVIQSVDLAARAADLARVRVDGALFLGCELPDESRDGLLERGALIFPRLPNLPFNPYRAMLYSPTELYDAVLAGRLYPQTRDAQIYGWARSVLEPTPLAESLAMTLHDHAITDALAEQLTGIAPTSIVGLMGGHAQQRGSDAYIGSARLAAQLTQAGFTIIEDRKSVV